ncbi:MAG: M17 family peptidase N-terminal domain-containing protein, partial [Alphaproteobacteria bacterium]
MTDLVKITIGKASRRTARVAVVLCSDKLAIGDRARALGVEKTLQRAAKAARFKGAARTTLSLFAPADIDADRLLVVGVGDPSTLSVHDWLRLGGATMGGLAKASAAAVYLERPDGEKLPAEAAAEFALGMKLRGYAFNDFKTGPG